MSRRQLVVGAGGGIAALAVAGFVGYRWPRPAADPPQSSTLKAATLSGLESFVSRPDLQPPRIKITRYRTANLASTSRRSPPFIFVAPRNYVAGAPGQAGLMVLDRLGRLIWFKPVPSGQPFDFNTQSYRGRSVLTWWQGQVVDGYGVGTGEIADSSYRTQQKIPSGAGLRADLHELLLTSSGTALVTAYQQVKADLSALGGPAEGKVLTGHAQEIDLATGKLLFDWNSLDHVALDESYQAVPKSRSGLFDYFHINSIAEMPDGNLLISARNTWALYKVDRSSGKVIWRLNGKKSDFTLGAGARFYWQHDARPYPDGSLTVFDDGSSPSEEKQSRGLLLNVDRSAMHVSLKRAYLHPAGFIAANQGNVQRLPNGDIFVGWGNQPYFSQFAADGTLLLDGEMPPGYRSYRAFCDGWAGRPPGSPAIAVRSNPAGGLLVYASWNGASNVDSWTVLAGKDPSSMDVVGSQEWGGFETAIAINSAGPHFAVVAVGNDGKDQGRSAPVKAVA